jgi:hypothetical protein
MIPASAYAACTGVPGVAGSNLQWFNCSSDNQAADSDDLKMFIDGTSTAFVNSALGSLGKNNNALNFANIQITSTGGNFQASTDANGFANFKSEVDSVTAYEATPVGVGVNLVAQNGAIFPGFDGELFRGQIVNNVATPTVTWDGDVSAVVTVDEGLLGDKTYTWTWTGLHTNTDIGVLGFDEQLEPGWKVVSSFAVAGDVTSAGVPIAAGLGAWDEFKQIEFSVPGEVDAVPEPKTWVMMLAGFGLLGFAAMRKGKREARLAI